MRDPAIGAADAVAAKKQMTWRDYRILLETPSFVLNTLGMTAMSFGMGALAWWMPDYLESHHVPDVPIFGLFNIDPRTVFGILVALAGLGGPLSAVRLATGFGRGCEDRISSCPVGGCWPAPCIVLMLFMPFPMAWLMVFAAVFLIFLNTGPTNAVLANVVHPLMRPAGFALNILNSSR